MKRFKSPEHAQRFLEVQGIVAQHFRPKRHLLEAANTDENETDDFRVWQQVNQVGASA